MRTVLVDYSNLGKEAEFVREDEKGRRVAIQACRIHESWEQWGAPKSILSDNVQDVEDWRHGRHSRVLSRVDRRRPS